MAVPAMIIKLKCQTTVRAAVAMLAGLTITLAMGAEQQIEQALMTATRKSLPPEISPDAINTALRGGLWNANKTAVAIAIKQPPASVIFVFFRETDATFLAVDVSGVENQNFGKLGIAGRTGYSRFETIPVLWKARTDGLYQLIMRTRAWKDGKRYTVSEPLVIKPDGTVLWR